MPKQLKDCKTYTLKGIEMIHIAEFAEITHRSIQSTRHLIEDGNKVRKLKFFRDRSRLMIPVVEITGYPLIDPGYTDLQRNIYHYMPDENGDLVKTLCKECTFGEPCTERQKAEELIVPEGDK